MRAALVAVFGFVAGLCGGVVSSMCLGEARAASGAIVVPVPEEGVVFRGPSGRVIARIREQSAGGEFEVFDAREGVALRLRATHHGGAFDTVGDGAVVAAPARRPVSGDLAGY